jgi:hypothetical protein
MIVEKVLGAGWKSEAGSMIYLASEVPLQYAGPKVVREVEDLLTHMYQPFRIQGV